MIIKLVRWLMDFTKSPYAITYRIPNGWKTYINCPVNEHVMNAMNNAWKHAMQDERKKLTKDYKKGRI